MLQPGVKKEASGVNPGGEGEAGEGEVEDDEFARIMSKLNELQMQEELEGEDGDDYISEEQDSSVESIEESELLGVVNGIGDKTNHNKIDYEKSAAKQESSISVLEKVSGHSSFIGEPMRYSDVRELTFRFMFMVICFFPHVLLLLMQPRVKEKAIQVLPERYPHKHADDLLKVRKTFYCNLLFFSFYKQTFLLLMLAT